MKVYFCSVHYDLPEWFFQVYPHLLMHHTVAIRPLVWRTPDMGSFEFEDINAARIRSDKIELGPTDFFTSTVQLAITDSVVDELNAGDIVVGDVDDEMARKVCAKGARCFRLRIKNWDGSPLRGSELFKAGAYLEEVNP
jgi:putative CRISPR-associated protein (TIGR02620 family)